MQEQAPPKKSNRNLSPEQQSAVKWLIDQGVVEEEDDVFKTDFSDGSNPCLHSQAIKGNFEAVERILKLDSSLTKLVYGSWAPLHKACAAQQGRLKTVKLLLQADPSQLTVKLTNGQTVLHIATVSPDDEGEVLQLLLKDGKGLLPMKRNKDHRTALHLAAQEGRLEMVKILVAEAAPLESTDDDGFTCLHLACEYGRKEVVDFLISSAASILEKPDTKGLTSLHHAAMKGHVDICKALLKANKGLLNIEDKDGRTCFQWCVENGKTEGHWAVVAILLESDGSLLKNQGDGVYGPLHYAAFFGQQKGVSICLEKLPGLLGNKTDKGNTAFHEAAQKGHTKVLEQLIASDSKKQVLEIQNNDGDSCLHVAAAEGHEEAVALLVKASTSLLKMKNTKGWNCLFSASCAAKPQVKIVKALLKAHQDLLWDTDSKGKTCLHHAAENGVSEDLVFTLAEVGKSKLIKAKDKNGDDCLAHASPNTADILEELLEREADDAKPRNV